MGQRAAIGVCACRWFARGLAACRDLDRVGEYGRIAQHAGTFFRRSNSRESPHNLFTDSVELAVFSGAAEPPADGLSEIGFLYTVPAPSAERPASQTIEYYFIYRETFVRWVYDPAANLYRYFRQNRPHVDARTGEQVQFRNLVVLEVPEAPIPGDTKGRIEQQVIGEGAARVFRDGQVIEATWRKPAGFAPLRIYGADGAEVPLVPGNVWIAAIPALTNLTIQTGN